MVDIIDHVPWLKRYLGKRLRRPQDVDDLVQEVYLRMLRVPDDSMIQNPHAYLITVANNLLKEHWSQERRERGAFDVDDPALQDELGVLPGFGAGLDLEARKRILLRALRELPPKCQAVIVMHYFHDMSYDEIAARLEMTPHNVKKYVTKGLKHFRLRMARWS